MASVRFCSAIAGDRRATVPAYTVGSPSTVTRTGCPRRTSAASRSGTESRSRKGWRRTRVTTGAPAARYSPTEACRSTTAPSIGERITVSVSCWRDELDLRAPLEQHGLAVLDLLQRVLVPALGDLERRHRRVELRARHVLLLPQPRQPVAIQLGLVEQRLRLAHHGGLGGSTRSSSPSAGSPSRTRACLSAATD